MFDPYHRWLGIPEGQRPPTYYQLLAIAPNEKDPEVIDEAAIRQTTHLRTYQIGPHAKECTRLLNEIATARTILLDPIKRQQYDAILKRKSGIWMAKPTPPPAKPKSGILKPAPIPKQTGARQVAEAASPPLLADLQPPRGPKRSWVPFTIALGTAVVGLGAVLALMFVNSQPDGPSPKQPVLARSGPGKEVPGQAKPAATNPDESKESSPPSARKPADEKVAVKSRPLTVEEGDSASDEEAVGEVRRFDGHVGQVHSVCFSPDGRQALTAGGDRTLRLWNVRTGAEIQRCEGHTNIVRIARFSPDGRQIVSGSLDGTVRLWNAKTGKEVKRFEGHRAPVGGVAFAPDGRHIVSSGGDNAVRLWDVTTAKEIQRFDGHTNMVWNVAVSSDGRRVLSASDDWTARLWDAKTGKELERFKGHAGVVGCVAFLPDGRSILTASHDRTLRLWEVKSAKEQKRLEGHSGQIWCMAASADGHYAISGGPDRTVRLWDLRTGKQIHRFDGHQREVMSVALSPDLHYALSCDQEPTVRLWRLPHAVKPAAAVALQANIPAKKPVPDPAQQARSEKDIKDLYKAEYAKTKPAELRGLAATLLKQSLDTKDNSCDRYVLLREAKDLAARAGDFETALHAVEELAGEFAVNGPELKVSALARAAEAGLIPETGRILAEAAFGLIDEAVAADDFDVALRLADLAEAVAKKAGWAAFAAKVDARHQELEGSQQDYEQVRQAAQTLRKTPDDPDANVQVGKYLCLVKGAWEKGLPLLARGGDPVLKDLAQKEAIDSADPDALIELADGWSALAAKEIGPAKTKMLLRARHWYELALPELKGLTKNKIELKIQEIAKNTTETSRPARPGLPGVTPGSFSLATRTGQGREQLVLDGGGNARSEAAVALGLVWLARHQKPDGHWSLDGYDPGLGGGGLEIGGTALGLLPFLGSGETPRKGNYAKVVDKGLTFLLRKQNGDGSFKANALYEHALATIAVCEAAVLTGDPRYKRPAQAALNYILRAQHVGGGWRYAPQQPGDTSVTGWQYTALKTGLAAGLTVPKANLQSVTRFLDAVQGQDGSVYRYMPNEGEFAATTTAIGSLTRQYQGWGTKNAALTAGIAQLLKPDNLPRAQNKNMYYYYYATQVLHHAGGKDWEAWSGRMRDQLIDTQEKGDAADRAGLKGSWAPQGDRWAQLGGRLMVSSLAVLTLEVYYRHVPLYLREQERPKE